MLSAMQCPLCQSPLTVIYYHRGVAVECTGSNCAFVVEAHADIIIAAVMAHHLRPLAKPHEFKENPDYPGQCDAVVDRPIRDAEGFVEEWQTVPCNRPKEAHQS